MHRFTNFKIIVIMVGLVCILMTQAAAKSESVPVIAQEFTKLFTVVALKIPRTSPTSLSVTQTNADRYRIMNEPKSLISNTNISCATWYGGCRKECGVLLYFLSVFHTADDVFLFIFLPDIEP